MSIIKQKTFFKKVVLTSASDKLPRQIIIAGTLTKSEGIETTESKDVVSKTDSITVIEKTTRTRINSQELSIGLAIANPVDIYDEEIGKTIAKGKSLKSKSAIFSLKTNQQVFSVKFVNGILDLVTQAIKDNPNKYLILSPKKDKEPDINTLIEKVIA